MVNAKVAAEQFAITCIDGRRCIELYSVPKNSDEIFSMVQRCFALQPVITSKRLLHPSIQELEFVCQHLRTVRETVGPVIISEIGVDMRFLPAPPTSAGVRERTLLLLPPRRCVTDDGAPRAGFHHHGVGRAIHPANRILGQHAAKIVLKVSENVRG